MTSAILMVVGIGGSGGRSWAADVENAVDPEAPPTPPDTQPHTEFFPLPLYAISPAEGSTYGVLPVFMTVDAKGDTTSITAPSVSLNQQAGVNGTFRYYKFPNDYRSWTFIVAASTRVNRSFRLEYRDVPGVPAHFTFEVQGLARKSLFYRFFGIGPDTPYAGQSTYTRVFGLLSVRGGVNAFKHFNVGVRGGLRGDRPELGGVTNLPKTQVLYPDAVGLGGAALATAELSLRYDTRQDGNYDERGFATEAHAARDFGIGASPSFWRFTWHTRVLVRENWFMTGAARLYWTDETGGDGVPFYYRSALGGDTLFRGFIDDRFIDRGAWQAEAEQRFKLFQTDWFRVRVDWRVDPFVAVGQVYPNFDNITSHVRPVGGIGLRLFIHPNILGRVDLAYSSDGFTAYVLLGYPY